MTGKEPDTGRLKGGAGLRAFTEVVVSRDGVNCDNMLIARTCPNCGNLMLNASVTDISGPDHYRVPVSTPDGRRYVLKES